MTNFHLKTSAGLLLIACVSACERSPRQSADPNYERYVENINRQNAIADDQLETTDRQLQQTADQLKEYERQTAAVDQQLKRSEEQAKRFDRLIEKWERQADREDRILSARERMLNIPSPADPESKADGSTH